jgi:hypothetical protein
MLVALILVAELERVDQPDERYQERAEEEHNGFLLDNSEIVFIIIFILESFNKDGHDGGCEEHTQGILEGE